jgi:hypothetical protein
MAFDASTGMSLFRLWAKSARRRNAQNCPRPVLTGRIGYNAIFNHVKLQMHSERPTDVSFGQSVHRPTGSQ